MIEHQDPYCTPDNCVCGVKVDNLRRGIYGNFTPEELGVGMGLHSKPLAISPDCRDGNHNKCDGVAWDTTTDDYTGCACSQCYHEGVGPQ